MTEVQRNIAADFVNVAHKSLQLNAGLVISRRSLDFARTAKRAFSGEMFDLILVEQLKSFLLVVQACF